MNLSLVMMVNNVNKLTIKTLRSAEGLWDDLLIDIEKNTEIVKSIIKKYDCKIYISGIKNFGLRKQFLVDHAKCDWILILDSDELLSEQLYNEINKLKQNTNGYISGYRIPYVNHVFGIPVYWGGERYCKIRLFKKVKGKVLPNILHEDISVKGGIGYLNNPILHFSYQTLPQIFIKFTKYAEILGKEKYMNNEKVSISKLFFYSPHMFYARFVKEKGYYDGWRGFILAIAFSYMEFMIYIFLTFYIIYNPNHHE